MRYFTATVAVVACILAGTALGVSVSHEGPRGPQGPAGPQGQTGRAAETAHLGVCWNMENVIDNAVTADPANPYAGGISTPVLTDGVPSCPVGQFVSIVPGG